MNKRDLIDAVYDKMGNRKTATDAVNAVIDTIQETVAGGDKVTITGFGVFEKQVRPPRTARNPATGAAVKVPKTSVPKFRAGADFKAMVNSKRGAAGAGASRATRATATRATATRATGTRATGTKATATRATATRATATRATGTRATATRATGTRATATRAAASSKTTGGRAATARTTAGRSAAGRSTARKAGAAQR